jgi:uncharacterized protein YdeI (YjbR/CyaY-like superfamily)
VKRPGPEDVRIFATAEDFRAWLHGHHATTTELFVGYYRKGAGKTAMTYVEAVMEALAYGWIDGITYRLSNEVTATRFTPRRRGSNWSEVNVGRMRELIAAGRAHPAGIAAFEKRTAVGTGVYSYENAPRDLPDELAARLRAVPKAWADWRARTPTYRRAATWWVLSAKREETRERRMEQLIDDCAAGRPIKPFRYGRVTLEPPDATLDR